MLIYLQGAFICYGKYTLSVNVRPWRSWWVTLRGRSSALTFVFEVYIMMRQHREKKYKRKTYKRDLEPIYLLLFFFFLLFICICRLWGCCCYPPEKMKKKIISKLRISISLLHFILHYFISSFFHFSIWPSHVSCIYFFYNTFIQFCTVTIFIRHNPKSI